MITTPLTSANLLQMTHNVNAQEKEGGAPLTVIPPPRINTNDDGASFC